MERFASPRLVPSKGGQAPWAETLSAIDSASCRSCNTSVPMERFELSRDCSHTVLNRACIPFHHIGNSYKLLPNSSGFYIPLV